MFLIVVAVIWWDFSAVADNLTPPTFEISFVYFSCGKEMNASFIWYVHSPKPGVYRVNASSFIFFFFCVFQPDCSVKRFLPQHTAEVFACGLVRWRLKQPISVPPLPLLLDVVTQTRLQRPWWSQQPPPRCTDATQLLARNSHNNELPQSIR